VSDTDIIPTVQYTPPLSPLSSKSPPNHAPLSPLSSQITSSWQPSGQMAWARRAREKLMVEARRPSGGRTAEEPAPPSCYRGSSPRPLPPTSTTRRQAPWQGKLGAGPASSTGAASRRQRGRGVVEVASQASSGWRRRRGQAGRRRGGDGDGATSRSGQARDGAGGGDRAASTWPELGDEEDAEERAEVVLQLPHPGRDLVGTAAATQVPGGGAVPAAAQGLCFRFVSLPRSLFYASAVR
jgi:hypothetical protein